MTTSSPSFNHVLSSAPSTTGSFPPLVASSRQPASPPASPDIVPLPRRSPVRMLHPVIVWCANICGKLHSKFFELVLVRVAPLISTASDISYTDFSSLSMRYFCSGVLEIRGRGVVRKGSSAHGSTIHGEIVVPKFLEVNGPSGTYSNAWISLAIHRQSLCSSSHALTNRAKTHRSNHS
jgi:hypothetical protein